MNEREDVFLMAAAGVEVEVQGYRRRGYVKPCLLRKTNRYVPGAPQVESDGESDLSAGG